jgi:hypothetical protein
MWIQFMGDDSVDVDCIADDLEILTDSKIKTKWGFLECQQHSLQLHGAITQNQNPHEHWTAMKAWNLLHVNHWQKYLLPIFFMSFTVGKENHIKWLYISQY